MPVLLEFDVYHAVICADATPSGNDFVGSVRSPEAGPRQRRAPRLLAVSLLIC